MTTASDIITRAARALGYLGRNEVLTASDANDGLNALNSLLDSWSSSESLMSYIEVERSFTLIAGTQTYTIGTGGMINTTRPTDIIRAFVRDANNLDYVMSVIPQDQWNSIGQKTITSQIPTTLFYYSDFPLGQINIFPIPLLPYTVFYDSTLDQVDFSLLTTTLSMPVGYERAYILNLAVELMGAGWPSMLNQTQLGALINNASEAKGNVKRSNIKEVVAKYDDAIVSKSYATYNVYSDGNPRN